MDLPSVRVAVFQIEAHRVSQEGNVSSECGAGMFGSLSAPRAVPGNDISIKNISLKTTCANTNVNEKSIFTLFQIIGL